jgi:pyridoxamine 5'-phosphate oxidase
MEINDISTDRVDYGLGQLERNDLSDSPIHQLTKWLSQARDAKLKDYNAFNFGTIDESGFPASRIVLLRECSSEGLTFFTNYESDKGQAIAREPKVTMNLFWPELERQVRVWGTAQKVTEAESDSYFQTRPRESQIGAWASRQSQVLDNRQELEKAVVDITDQFKGMDIPRPPHWGGFRIAPLKFEFWQGRSSRLHDRFVYQMFNNDWRITRLNP